MTTFLWIIGGITAALFAFGFGISAYQFAKEIWRTLRQ